MKKKSAIDEFIVLRDSERERIVREIEAETPQERLAKSRPLNAGERAAWAAFKRKAGRPRLGKNGVEKVSISVEQSLLKIRDDSDQLVDKEQKAKESERTPIDGG
jgi:hypothetical protein